MTQKFAILCITKRLASERMVAMNGIFGDLFDFNHDGKLDTFEQAAEFSFFSELMDEEEKREALEAEGLDQDDYDLDDF